MRKILVTAISGNIGNGILKILKPQNCLLYGCDVNEFAAGMDLVQEYWQSKYAVQEGYLEELLEKCRHYGITHLIPVNEREIEVIGKERKKFEDIQVKVLIQSQEILNQCLDKYKTMQLLADHGLDVPDTYLIKDEIPYEEKCYICKPRKSNGSKGISVYQSKRDIVEQAGADFIYQEYINSDEEYTIGVFKNNNTVNVISFLRKLKDGYSYQVELSENESIVKIAHRVADLLELKGFINIQLRHLNGRYFIFEINPRISGTVRFRHLLGFQDVLWWLDLVDQKETEPYQSIYHKAIGIRELNEKYLILE